MKQIDLLKKDHPEKKEKTPKRAPPKERCARCGRMVEKIDADAGQCIKCNAEWLHEHARQLLIASLPPAQARLYMLQDERNRSERIEEMIDKMGDSNDFGDEDI